ncbi:MAG: hypothetical protein CVT77_02185 [Alphaproteobacteria bacterium HGW-Alphaproteobacteria-16]|nr:MAG: hypothetical protein CVT77_02185 [Alphaproteobacteria bacterium HGW-Alphaproteobacteria-16]
MHRNLLCGAAMLIASPALAADAPWNLQPRGPVYAGAVTPMDNSVRDRLIPQMDALMEQLIERRREMTLGGVKIFESGDKFLPGKIAMAMAYRITLLPPDDPRLDARLRQFSEIADLTLPDTNDSWGIYYYISALYTLQERGLLDRAVSPATLALLRERLDWRRFVRPDLTLIDLPNNYYGVAFAIARLRFLLKWEDEAPGDALLARTLDHYRRYSGTYGFADETEGEGRFDRYSVLLIGEIAQRLIETGKTPPPDVVRWLRQSIDLILPRLNLHGEGFEYGRSIGPYGETAFLEVLTAAAQLGVLTPVESRMAYAYSSRAMARYLDFWINPETASVDMWSQGRGTDAYRGIHRIFGENLSLARQYLYTNAIWSDLGYRGQTPDPGYAKWLETLPRVTKSWFARGEYDRAVVTMRDRGRVISLPIVNGAGGQHMHNPYFPIPFSPGMLQGVADAGFPQLIPRITLTDGSVLMPLAFFKDVRMRRQGAVTHVTWRQDALDRMGADAPQADDRARIVTRYRFQSGRIVREDRLTLKPGIGVASIEMEFATFSDGATGNANRIAFARGDVRGFAARGYGDCAATPASGPQYRSPVGGFATVVRCQTQPGNGVRSIDLKWELSYN